MPVVMHKEGSTFPLVLRRMYSSHGPWMLGQYRLDRLTEATVLQDSSTVSSYGTSTGDISTPIAGQLARGIAGAVLAGPVGAIIASGGATQKTQSDTVTHGVHNLNVFMRLTFKEEAPINVQINDESSFKTIVSCVNQPEWTEERLAKAAKDGKRAASQALIEKAKAAKVQRRAGTIAYRVGGISFVILFGFFLFKLFSASPISNDFGLIALTVSISFLSASFLAGLLAYLAHGIAKMMSSGED